MLTITPFPKVLCFKQYLIENFGHIKRVVWSYETVVENYKRTTLKAPDKFNPNNDVLFSEKSNLISDIENILTLIKDGLENYTELELDSITIPHPLLGKLTIREMFYVMSYHRLHDKMQIQEIEGLDKY